MKKKLCVFIELTPDVLFDIRHKNDLDISLYVHNYRPFVFL